MSTYKELPFAVTEQEIIDCGFTLESILSVNSNTAIRTIFKQDNFLVNYDKPYYGYGRVVVYQPQNEEDNEFECEIRSKEEFKDIIEFCKKHRIK